MLSETRSLAGLRFRKKCSVRSKVFNSVSRGVPNPKFPLRGWPPKAWVSPSLSYKKLTLNFFLFYLFSSLSSYFPSLSSHLHTEEHSSRGWEHVPLKNAARLALQKWPWHAFGYVYRSIWLTVPHSHAFFLFFLIPRLCPIVLICTYKRSRLIHKTGD